MAHNKDTLPYFHSRLTSQAPTNSTAKIIERSAPEDDVVTYTVQIGSVPIPNISAFEIYDYVSPHQLEQFENKLFKEEAEAREAIEQARLHAKQQRARRERNSHSLSSASPSAGENDSVSGASTSAADITGRRQRPTYTQFYPKQRAPRGSGKSKVSAEIVVPITQRQASIYNQSANNANKRDNKRRRVDEGRSASVSSGAAQSVYSIDSLDQQIQPPTAMEKAAGLGSPTLQVSEAMDLDDGEDVEMSEPASISVGAPSKPPSGNFFAFREHAASTSKNASTSSSEKQKPLSAKARLMAMSTERASAPPAKVSSPHAPTAPRQTSAPVKAGTSTKSGASSRTAPATTSATFQPLTDSEPSDAESDEEVYSVEKIVAHNLSDPRTHDRSVHGSEPVMLFQVKWEGYDELTWEPATSFEDSTILDEYWAEQEARRRSAKKG